MININKSEDINYRYKMPTISIKLGGAGNGIFTIINNMDEISKYINTPSDILFKYISYTTGSAYNEKKSSITGHHPKLQDIIFNYIDDFVICQSCGIPELSYSLEKINSKNSNLICKCLACGTINNINSNNKVNNKCIDTIIKYLVKEKTWVLNTSYEKK
jgi:translation initiation factor 5